MATYSGVFDNNGYTLYLDVSESNVSSANNTSTVNWTLRIVSTKSLQYGSWDYDGTPYSVSIDGSVVASASKSYDFRNYQNLTVASGSKTITHGSDGKKSVSCSASFGNSGTPIGDASASGTFNLTDIPRNATITSAPNFNDEQNPTINYENKAGYNVTSLQACISLTGALADITYRDIPKNGTSYTFNLTDAERNVLRNATKNSNSRTLYFVIRTVINDNTITNSALRTLTIVNANPTFGASNVTYEDTNSSVVAITKNNQHIVQNKSNVKVNYTSATAKKGATISSYSFSLNGVTQGVTGSSGAVIFGTINSSSDLTLTATAIDSRGNKTSVSKKVTILPYSVPNAIVTLNRLNNYEDTTYLTVDGSIASVNSKNVMTIKYRYKLSGGSYNSFVTISDNIKKTLSLNKNNIYIFNVVVSDSFGGKYDKEIALPKGVFPLFIDVEKNSLGINCFPTKERVIEIAGDNGNETIYSMSTGTWTPKIGALNETDPTITYTHQRGNYTKIGKMVFISIYLRGRITALKGTNNYACIKGLPFTAKDYAMGQQSFGIGVIYNLVTSSTDLSLGINNQVIRVQNSYGAGASNLKVSGNTDFEIGCSGWYEME